jgi:chromate reductase
MKIAVLVGSLRKESYSRKLAKALIAFGGSKMQMDIIDLGELPIYNQDSDDEGKAPAAWLEFRKTMSKYEGVLFVTPEYNRSVPALLKNAIDVGSRPYGKSIWDGKAAAVISISPGAVGGFGANHHLRQSLVFLNMPTMQQPEAYIGDAAKLFDPKGDLLNNSTAEFAKNFMSAFSIWVNQKK